ncbi:MAG: glutaredoxin [Solobacterium sp.]|nr:glutaredoxin [Solobacterium sp.]
MFTIYGSSMCPDCVACKKNFDFYGIKYDFIDINESMKNLKEFLRYRDQNPVFDSAREAGDIGLPALLKEDGSITLDWESIITEKGYFILEDEEPKEACGIGRKGC